MAAAPDARARPAANNRGIVRDQMGISAAEQGSRPVLALLEGQRRLDKPFHPVVQRANGAERLAPCHLDVQGRLEIVGLEQQGRCLDIVRLQRKQ